MLPAKGKVLLIDDAADAHMLVERLITSINLEFIGAFDGAQGIALALVEQPGLILLDVSLSIETGFDICRRLKSSSDTAGIQVIFLSAEAGIQERVLGLDLGAVDYIIKPVNPVELQARVRAALRTKYLMDLLENRARIDGLTGLHNRAYFEERFIASLSNARRHGRDFSLLILDIDHFKKVNDTFGHSVGDQALRTIGSIVQSRCRNEDIVCRYGGEEFVILTPDVPLQGAATLAESLRSIIEAARIEGARSVVNVTASIGVAQALPESQMSLIARADEALYFAKNQGRNRVAVEERARDGHSQAA